MKSNQTPNSEPSPNPSSSNYSETLLFIKNAPDGNGTEISSFNIYKPQSLYAVYRNANGDFISNESVNRSESGSFGFFTNTNGSSTKFIPVAQSGTTSITTGHSSLTNKSINLTIDFSSIPNIS